MDNRGKLKDTFVAQCVWTRSWGDFRPPSHSDEENDEHSVEADTDRADIWTVRPRGCFIYEADITGNPEVNCCYQAIAILDLVVSAMAIFQSNRANFFGAGVLLVLTTIREPGWTIAYLPVFGLVTIAAMMVITIMLGVPFAYTGKRFARFTAA